MSTPVAYIYGLYCPVANAIRYIGKANDPEKRLQGHLRECKKGSTHRDNWLAKLAKEGIKPFLVILRTISPDENWSKIEQDEISKAFSSGWPLTNLTKGGDGGELTPAGRKRFLAAVRSPENRKKLSERAKTFFANPVARARIAESNRLRSADPGWKRRKEARQCAS